MISHTGGWWRGADDLNGSNAGIAYCLSPRCELDALTDATTVTRCRIALQQHLTVLRHIHMQLPYASCRDAGLTCTRPARALSVLDSYLPAIRSMYSPILQAAWTRRTHLLLPNENLVACDEACLCLTLSVGVEPGIVSQAFPSNVSSCC